MVLLVVIALVFNPIPPLRLTEELWSFIDLPVVAFFVATALMLGKNSTSER
jgi:hypothetical protein